MGEIGNSLNIHGYSIQFKFIFKYFIILYSIQMRILRENIHFQVISSKE